MPGYDPILAHFLAFDAIVSVSHAFDGSFLDIHCSFFFLFFSQYSTSSVDRLLRQFVGAKRFVGRMLSGGSTRTEFRGGLERERSATPDITPGRHSMETPQTQSREIVPHRASVSTPSGIASDAPSFGDHGFQRRSPPPFGYGTHGAGSSSIHGDYEIPVSGQTQGGHGGTGGSFVRADYEIPRGGQTQGGYGGAGGSYVHGDYGVPGGDPSRGGYGGPGAFDFSYLFAGLPYQPYPAQPGEQCSDSEGDDVEPVGRSSPVPEASGSQSTSRGKRPMT